MSAKPLKPHTPVVRRADAEPDGHWRRVFPQLCAPDPRLEILRYELYGGPQPDGAAGDPLQVLANLLERALGRWPELGMPGDVPRTFDERWLLAVLDALSQTDLRWYQFLLRSRMAAGDAARVHFAFARVQVWLEQRV